MANARALSFFETSVTNMRQATSLLGHQSDLALAPYFSREYIGYVYPLSNTFKLLAGAFRLVQGTCLLISAIINNPLTAIPQIVAGMLAETVAIVFNVLNIVASITTLLTRSAITLYSGYQCNDWKQFTDQNIDDRNQVQQTFFEIEQALNKESTNISNTLVYVNR